VSASKPPTKIYSATWVVPESDSIISDGAIAVTGSKITAVGKKAELLQQFREAAISELGEAAIVPGFVNAHSHLELTAMRGYLQDVETNFFAWLKKLTLARLEKMTPDDLRDAAAWGACEAARAGVTCVGDASDAALQSMHALKDVGLRGIVFQESFGPDTRLVKENFEKLQNKMFILREEQTGLVKCGVSPHAPYTVCAPQLELISQFAVENDLRVMMHAAETTMEISLLKDGSGPFAEGLKQRQIEWKVPGVSPVKYLDQHGILASKPLLAHCIYIDDEDIELLRARDARVAHCPKSNARFGHGIAPLMKMLEAEIKVGLGSDSVASNNTCDLLEEARFALLLSRAITKDRGGSLLTTRELFNTATAGGAEALGLEKEIGKLREGYEADFAVVSLTGVHQIPSYDPLDALLSTSSGRDVKLTVVAGREVYRDGQVTTVDEKRLRERMKEISAKLTLQKTDSALQ
jgi:cytosine/adenosine deaminase-related metal-dependent hydrolase